MALQSESNICVIAGSQLVGPCGSLTLTVSRWSLGRWVFMCTVAVAHAMHWWVIIVWVQMQTQLNQNSTYFPLKQYSAFYLISSGDCGAINCGVKLICLDWFLAMVCWNCFWVSYGVGSWLQQKGFTVAKVLLLAVFSVFSQHKKQNKTLKQCSSTRKMHRCDVESWIFPPCGGIFSAFTPIRTSQNYE